MKKLKLAVIGANGRMGQAIASQRNSPQFRLWLGIVRSGKARNYLNSSKEIHYLSKYLPDVVIDFSAPQCLSKVIQECAKYKIPLVVGTTGLTATQQKLLKNASKKIPVFYSANMSIGVEWMRQCLSLFSEVPGFRFQIIEKHHVHKKDRPSGTALMLQQELKKRVKENLAKPISIRKGNIVGIHQLVIESTNEKIIFKHQALSRKLFAEGALFASQWLSHQKPGLYSMKDMVSDGV